MVRCEVIKEFTLDKFNELKDLNRYNPNLKEEGKLYVKDTFNCTDEMADYLMGNNSKNKIVIKMLEYIEDEKPVKKTTKKSTKNKKLSY